MTSERKDLVDRIVTQIVMSSDTLRYIRNIVEHTLDEAEQKRESRSRSPVRSSSSSSRARSRSRYSSTVRNYSPVSPNYSPNSPNYDPPSDSEDDVIFMPPSLPPSSGTFSRPSLPLSTSTSSRVNQPFVPPRQAAVEPPRSSRVVNTECMICLDQFRADGPVTRQLPCCGKMFHRRCIRRALSFDVQSRCPNCRRRVDVSQLN